MLQLEIRSPLEPPRTVRLETGVYTFGRSSAALIPLKDPLLSRLHARVRVEEDRVLVEDMESRNGTYVNGRKVGGAVALTRGDRITIGNTVLVLGDEASTRVVVDESAGPTPVEGMTLFPSDALLRAVRPGATEGAPGRAGREEPFEVLYEVTRELLHDRSEGELFRLIVDRLFEILGPDRAVVLLKDPDGGFQEAVSRFGDGIPPGDLVLSRTVLDAVAGERRAALFVAGSPAADVPSVSLVIQGITSCLAAPLCVGDEVLGLVYLDARLGHRQFGEPDVRLVTALANAAAVRIRSARLAEAAALREAAEREREVAQTARRAAEEASRVKSLFLASMSHELRTPLNAILGYAEMLTEEATERGLGDLLPDLQKIQGAGRHLLELINDILDLSKIEAGKLDLVREPFDVQALLSDVAQTMRPAVERNGNAFAYRPGEPPGMVLADVTRTRQVLYNLLSNAGKFTENGRVTLECSRASDDSGEWVVVRVADTGIGMTPEQQSRLFQPFSQADAGTARKYGGTGLGLVISRRLCQMMGGDITVESEPTAGSTFFLKLPAAVEPSVGETITGAVPVLPPQG
ncbi:MAG: FHA domain-containing protein [Acidobacteria bacterium]|nr:MAG: FHA domain-containing protein [Acidobacteriota bacterium]